MASKKKSKESKKRRWPSPPGSGGGAVSLPESTRSKLWELFGQIEHEFELIHSENTALRERVEKLEGLVTERTTEPSPQLQLQQEASSSTAGTPVGGPGGSEGHTFLTTPSRKVKIKNSVPSITQKLKTYTPSKKTRSNLTVECTQVCVYSGHRDGVWQVRHSRNGLPLIGTASADGTACIWEVETGNILMKYVGHSGSVNSIAFHPVEHLACTASGDSSAHIWRCAVSLPPRRQSGSNIGERAINKFDSSGEDRYSDEDPLASEAVDSPSSVIGKTSASMVLTAHSAPVMSCDWLSDGHQLVTASWDHTAKLWDSESAQVIHSLTGHDKALTHVCAHPTQQLVVTSSEDTTFRLWDFRAPPIHSVNVFQGHSKSVNSAVFSLRENVVSGSDDHTVKFWDLRNMRSPVDSVRLDCGINRISVSHDDHRILAVPLDSRHIRLYDLAGNRLAHLPRRNRMGHHRMVYSVDWSPDSLMSTGRCNFFSSGFDSKVIGWKVRV